MRPNLDVDARRHKQNEITTQVTECRLEYQQNAKGDTNHRKGAHAPVIHDPIDHHAPEQDRRDGQHPEKDGTKAEIARDPPVAQQLSGNPGHPEWAVLVAQPVIALHENDVASPGRGKAGLIEQQRGLFVAVGVAQNDDRGPSGEPGLGPHQHHRGAVAQQHDCRQCGAHLKQIAPTQPRNAGAQPARMGDAERFRYRGVASLQLVVADQLLLRQLHAAVPRHDDQAAEQRAGRFAGLIERVDARWFI